LVLFASESGGEQEFDELQIKIRMVKRKYLNFLGKD
jgi:hypothetical protein